MVRFLSFKDRDLVMSRARNLEGSNPLLFVREDVSEVVRNKQKGFLPLRNSLRADNKRAVIRHDKLRTEVGTFTFDLKKQEIVKLDPTPVVPVTRLRRSLCVARTDRSTQPMPAVPQNHRLPTWTTSRPTSPNQMTAQSKTFFRCTGSV